MGDEVVAELGMSMEKRLTGGMVMNMPMDAGPDFTPTELQGTRIWALGQMDFPGDISSTRSGQYYNAGWTWPDPMLMTRYIIPTLYMAHMQSDDFWARYVYTYGQEVVTAPRYFETDVLYTTSMERMYSVRLSDKRHQFFRDPRNHSLYQPALDDWEKRQALWKALRPWYAEECMLPLFHLLPPQPGK